MLAYISICCLTFEYREELINFGSGRVDVWRKPNGVTFADFEWANNNLVVAK